MPDDCLAVDTGVLITLAAAMGGWDVFGVLETPVSVPLAVWEELRRGSPDKPGAGTPLSPCMTIWSRDILVPPWLSATLDKGEASVIGLAMEQRWTEVAVDEAVGRSVARTCGLRLTGSLGILIRAKRKGYPVTLKKAIANIRAAGIWLGKEVENAALAAAEEKPDSVA